MSETKTVSPLRQRMIEDMAARKLNPHTQRSHIYSCKRFAAWLKHSPDTATADEVRLFQLYLIESGMSICNRNRIMTGVRFLLRVTLRRHDLAAEVWHIKEPQKLPPVLSPEEVKRVLTMATSLKAQAMLTLAYGCGLRAGEVVRLRAGDIDSLPCFQPSGLCRTMRKVLACRCGSMRWSCIVRGNGGHAGSPVISTSSWSWIDSLRRCYRTRARAPAGSTSCRRWCAIG